MPELKEALDKVKAEEQAENAPEEKTKENEEEKTPEKVESKEEEPQVDYKAELEKAKGIIEHKEKIIKQEKEKNKEEEEDFEEKEREVAEQVREMIAQEQEDFRRSLVSDTMEDMIDSVSSSEDEAKLIKYHIEHSVKLAGTSRKQIAQTVKAAKILQKHQLFHG